MLPIVGTVRTSCAQASDGPAAAEPATVPARSYGWQIAVADVSSLALVGTSVVTFAAGDRTKGSVFAWPASSG